MNSLKGKVAVVAGATQGAGRGIALMLGEAGATVYVTGCSVHGKPATRRPETIEETAEMVDARGGKGIAVRVDHTVEEEVKNLFERIEKEQDGCLDLLVNNLGDGDTWMEWGMAFWELPPHKGIRLQERAVNSRILTSRYAVPLMVIRNQGLIIEITDGVDYRYRRDTSLYYSLTKISAIHLAEGMAEELRPHNITSVSLTPGFLRSEAMLDHLGVTEANWREGAKKNPHFIASETPSYIGKAVTCLAADPYVEEKSGRALSTWELVEEYGFTDEDGRQPHWGRYFKEYVEPFL
ncbi:SDR family oxidoreductase [Salinithrix halophila]|uniref:SDR family oxidoreductase n=1 Tax=Salinithrix halophila TaxID=1485204 RepID=A0ABV8JDG4_9BACL